MRYEKEDVVLVVAPHPDDEVIACGGTVIKRILEGRSVKLIFTTDGSRSHAAVLQIYSDPTPEELVRVRRVEAINAARLLGIPKESVYFLDAEDTKLHLSLAEVRRGLLRILSKYQSASEIYVPHDVRELNSDHRLTGQLVIECVEQLQMRGQVFKYVVWDENTEREFGFANRGDLREPADQCEEMLTVDIHDHLEQKIAAFNQHKTQVSLFSPAQTRPVVPPDFKKRLEMQGNECFFVHPRENRTEMV
jgi:LmbE family N-acetylglucosaminyl deacetylase